TTPLGMFQLTITPGGALNGCAVPAQAGRDDFPFGVTVKNVGSAAALEARLSVNVSEPTPAPKGAEVASLAFQGTCLNFTDPSGSLAPGQSSTYRGTAANVTSAAKLTAAIISSPDNSTLGSVSLPLGG
ncbi:MAG: hypothetical protein ACRD0H_08615, partial [Actinomycetes bacterium]